MTQENIKNVNNNIEEVLSFCVSLSRNMILSGANLERVHLAIEFICKTYGLRDLSIFLLSTHISVGAYDKDGVYAYRQASIPPAGINLERLTKLNQLSYKVAEIKPSTKLLEKMLERAMNVNNFPDWVILLARISAMSCLCFMFGGGFADLVTVGVVTALIHFAMIFFENTGLDKIVINAVIMWVATAAAVFFTYTGVGHNLSAILITVSMIVIPGIPLVNAARNLLCGNEINGILQMLKIFIETMALGLGIFTALIMFEKYTSINSIIAAAALNPYILIMLSYAASVSFGIVFGVSMKDLWLAGLGGGLTRIALIVLTPMMPNRLLYMTLSSSVAALYAEFLAVKRRMPSTYFVYPAIIPLIPGDLFFYALTGFFLKNKSIIETNGINCLLSLAGLSIGFVLSSTVSHYVRKKKYSKIQ